MNLGFAPYITHDLGLSGADLGLLTSLYFLGFAAAQIPVGILLDRFGPRRATAGMLLFAALGIGVFGAAHGIGAMMLGRLLIGVGVSVCMSAAFKALAQILPVAQLPMVNGLVMAVGGLGGVVVGSPLALLLGVTDWRNVCYGLVAMTLAVAAAIFLLHRNIETACIEKPTCSLSSRARCAFCAAVRSGRSRRFRSLHKAFSTPCSRYGSGPTFSMSWA